MDNSNFLPWVEKYRPNNINEIISHAQNIETIKKLLIGGSLPHLLFHGSSGTGKTSTIIALAKEIYGNNIRLMVMKLYQILIYHMLIQILIYLMQMTV